MRLIAAERELDPLLHCSKGPHPNPLPAILGLSQGTERKARVGEELLAGMTLLQEP